MSESIKFTDNFQVGKLKHGVEVMLNNYHVNPFSFIVRIKETPSFHYPVVKWIGNVRDKNTTFKYPILKDKILELTVGDETYYGETMEGGHFDVITIKARFLPNKKTLKEVKLVFEKDMQKKTYGRYTIERLHHSRIGYSYIVHIKNQSKHMMHQPKTRTLDAFVTDGHVFTFQNELKDDRTCVIIKKF